MSLRGTLGDFGIADIFQLIGHQAKTGVLRLKDKDEIRIFFVDGNVVKAEQTAREKSDLLGNMMVRARAITADELARALQLQQRTLRRLGDVLIEIGAADRATLKEFARLQTTETIYRLFQWGAGTYEFTAEAVDYDDQSYDPVRSESILMEGFRIVDEWPAVRRLVPSVLCTFEILATPPPPEDDDDDDDLAGFHDAFSEDSAPNKKAKKMALGAAERRIFPLVEPGLTVAEITDLSRLGEFETTKALAALAASGFLRVVTPALDAEPAAKQTAAELAIELRSFCVRLALTAAVATLMTLVVRGAGAVEGGALADDIPRVQSEAIIDKLGEVGRARLATALETQRLLAGQYPKNLDELVDAGLVRVKDLTFPYVNRYVYRVHDNGDGFDLALPLR